MSEPAKQSAADAHDALSVALRHLVFSMFLTINFLWMPEFRHLQSNRPLMLMMRSRLLSDGVILNVAEQFPIDARCWSRQNGRPLMLMMRSSLLSDVVSRYFAEQSSIDAGTIRNLQSGRPLMNMMRRCLEVQCCKAIPIAAWVSEPAKRS